MSWCDCDRWEGLVDLECGGQAGLLVTPCNPEATRQPQPFQCEAMSFHLTRGRDVAHAVLTALLPHYRELRPRYLDFLGTEADALMPDVHSPEELRSLIDLRAVRIHPWSKDGIGYVGLQFGCTWDVEHGLGLMMHLDRVVDIGGADVSFAWEPDEADTATP